MATPSSTIENNVHTVHLTPTVFYDPILFHYVSHGWDLEELLSGRVRTSTSTFTTISIPVLPTRTDSKTATYCIGASQLRREALRSIFCCWGFGHGEGDGDGAQDEGNDAAEGALEAALDRWMPFTYLSVHGGIRSHSAKPSTCNSAAPSVCIVDDEPTEEDPKHQRVLAAAQPHINGSTKGESQALLHKQADKKSKAPLLLSAASSSSATLVLSLVKDAHSWRKLRREAFRASTLRPDASHALTTGDESMATEANRSAAKEAQQRRCTSACTSSELFVSEDDALFTRWLESTRALREPWRRLWRQRHTEESAVAPPPHWPHRIRSSSSTSTSSSSSSSAEAKEVMPRSGEPANDRHVDRPAAGASADTEARRAAILASIERRRQR
ncbi:hypothetical protein ABL78_3444 [Leptomonas seymouri]|uniref:Uncharacterized protein n=1 Tax=Leptomonas seymouri TaxID=5684 RepID=A0A0N1ILB2_LEPSE|nr:hypothetical protein ABL78_3444 [Leptomonas seymouri]|eukprot:KPI87455.1 hypothetical protein ABL78_3444 [Leptomonas seymouri]